MRVRGIFLPVMFLFGIGFAASGLSLGPIEAHADGRPQDEQQQPHITTRQYNNRLPPVLPGEEVVTETGQRMRVWSSSGPVPMNQQPTPQQIPSGVGGTGGIGVIVDGRDRNGPQPPMQQPNPPGQDLLRR